MDRGWNDPPMFHCEVGSDSTPAPPKAKLQLNKRVAYPSLVSSSKTASSAPLQPKPNQLSEIASSPPRLHPFLKGAPPRAPFSADIPITCPIPSPSSSTSTSSSSSEAKTQTSSSSPPASSTSSPSSVRERREKVIVCLRTLTDNLRQKGALPEKQSSDITKKIDCLNQQWLGGGGGGAGQDGDPALDDDVQDKLCKMVEAIEEEKWEQALKIQVALAVDHAGVAKKWVMAVKKLISTAQTNAPTQQQRPEHEEQPPQYFLPSLS